MPVDPGTASIAAAGIDAGVSLIAAGSGGPSLRKRKRDQRELIQNSTKYSWASTMEAARKHGIHPLAALGVMPSPSGGSFIPGQSPKGSHLADAGNAVARGIVGAANARRNDELLQAQIDLIKAQTRQITAQTPTDPNQPIPGQDVPIGTDITRQQRPVIVRKVDMDRDTSSEGLVELKPAEQQTHSPGDKSTVASDMPYRRRLIYGAKGEFIYIPNVDELGDLMEEPLVAAGIIAAMNPGLTKKKALEILRGGGLKVTKPEKNPKRKVIFELPWGLFRITKGAD